MQRAFIIWERAYQRILFKKFLTSSLWNVLEAGGFNINEHTVDHTKQHHTLKLYVRSPQCFLKWKLLLQRLLPIIHPSTETSFKIMFKMALVQVSMAKNRFRFGSGCMAPCSLLILAFFSFLSSVLIFIPPFLWVLTKQFHLISFLSLLLLGPRAGARRSRWAVPQAQGYKSSKLVLYEL